MTKLAANSKRVVCTAGSSETLEVADRPTSAEEALSLVVLVLCWLSCYMLFACCCLFAVDFCRRSIRSPRGVAEKTRDDNDNNNNNKENNDNNNNEKIM